MKVLRLRRTEPLGSVENALNHIGVGIGDEFVIASRASYDPGSDPGSNQAVRGKAEESRKAALRVWPTTGSKRWLVIRSLDGGALTREGIIARSGVAPNTARPRILEAIDGGWIRQCRSRPFSDGKEMLELTEDGWAMLQSDLVTSDEGRFV